LVTGARSFFLDQVQANGTLQQVRVSRKTDITDFSQAQNGNNCDTCTKLADDMVKTIEAMEHVVGVTRFIDVGSFDAISLNNKKLTVERVMAYDANGIIVNNVLAGRDIETSDKEGVITITSDYADKFGFKNNYAGIIGKEVQLQTRGFYSGVGATIQKPVQCNGPCNNNQQQQEPTILTAKIVGVIDTSENSTTIRVPLDWARGMNENQRYDPIQVDQATQEAACRNVRGQCTPPQPEYKLVVEDMLANNGYGGLTVKVDNSQNAAAVATNIRTLNVGAVDASSSVKQQLQIFNIMGLVLGGIGGISLAVAAIGVVNTMVMAILERTREIGVMRAVGARRSTIRKLFTFEASMLGFWGGVFGVAAGFGLTRIANVVVNKQLAGQGVKAHNIIGLPIWLILAVIGIATLIGMFAGLYPAARAAHLDPVEALRYE